MFTQCNTLEKEKMYRRYLCCTNFPGPKEEMGKEVICNKCDHAMFLHGCVGLIGYCMDGNGKWCNCTEKGLTYDEEVELLITT